MEPLAEDIVYRTEKAWTAKFDEPNLIFLLHRPLSSVRNDENIHVHVNCVFSIFLLPHGLKDYSKQGVNRNEDKVLFWGIAYLDDPVSGWVNAVHAIPIKYTDITDTYRIMFSILKLRGERKRKREFVKELIAYGSDRIKELKTLLSNCVVEQPYISGESLTPKELQELMEK